MEEFEKGSTPLLHLDTSVQEVPLHTPLQIWFGLSKENDYLYDSR
jgi:hypothetical protein